MPIYQTSTYAQEGVNQNKGYDYARTANPTRTRACRLPSPRWKAAPGGWPTPAAWPPCRTSCTCSAPATTSCSPTTATAAPTGWSRKILARYGVEYSMVDLSDLERCAAACSDTTKHGLGRDADQPVPQDRRHSPASPSCCERGGAKPLFVVDNTFASPYLQQPLALGADLVVHQPPSTWAGTRTSCRALVVGNDPEIYETLKFHQNAAGAVPGPFDCWLVLRGLKTLGVRMREHCANAQRDRRVAATATRPSSASTTPAWPSTPTTTSRRARCAASPAWSRSRRAAASRAPAHRRRDQDLHAGREPGRRRVADRASRAR